MKTQGEIEASISEGMARFEQEYMGRGPKNIQTHLIDGLLVVRHCAHMVVRGIHTEKKSVPFSE